MLVKDVMVTAPVTVEARAPLWNAIQVMLTRKVSGVPVIDDTGALVGVLSEGDLLRRAELGTTRHEESWFRSLFNAGGLAEAYKLSHARRVADAMSTSLVTISPEARLEDAVALMEQHRIKRLPVLNGGKLVGILTRADFLRALAPMLAAPYEEPATSDAEIERTIRDDLRRQSWAANSAISVQSRDGHVTLSGTILSEAQRDAARVLAENVNGVRSVADKLVWADPMLQFILCPIDGLY